MKKIHGVMSRYNKGFQEALTDDKYKSDLEVAEAIGSFYRDSPDSPFQEGYLAGLKTRFMKMQGKAP